jgi:hypothetical protein
MSRLPQSRPLNTAAVRVRSLALVTLYLVIATCRSDGVLCSPGCGATGLLKVVPDSVAESAAAGSTTPLVDTLSVQNMGGGSLSWTARTLHASRWLALQPDSGVAGGALRVRDDPTGLALGEYRDTVLVSGSTAGIIVVGVVLRIHP